MKGGMMVDMQNGFVPISSNFEESTARAVSVKGKKANTNSTKLSINERYRRLIPYMTFYYANDLATPTTDNVKDVEVEKAEIIEAGGVRPDHQRETKKIVYSNRYIPRYQGNRLTQHNIASANPTKIYYKGGVPVYQTSSKTSPNYNPLLQEYKVLVHNDYEPGRVIHKPLSKNPFGFLSPTRKPFLNFYNDDTPNIRYYLAEKEQSPKYKLVPYEQTPPVKVPENENIYDITKKPVPVPVSGLIPKERIYLKPRPARPHYIYEEVNSQQPIIRKQPVIVSESYYEKQRPSLAQQSVLVSEPIVESGFKPILNAPQYTKEETVYSTATPETVITEIRPQKHRGPSGPVITIDDLRPKYYQYLVEQTTAKPPRVTTSNSIPLASLLNSLQLNKSIPKPITKENVGSSIRTLLQVLNALKAMPQNNAEAPVLSSPKPFVAPEVTIKPFVSEVSGKPVIGVQPATEPPQTVADEDLPEEQYLAHVNVPSQHLDGESPHLSVRYNHNYCK